jgi:drug/metabolite transporter (DMT)-like permease
MAGFAVSDALAKHLAPRVGVGELVWFRYALLTLGIAPLLLRNPGLLRSERKLFQAGRCLGMLGAALLFVSALARMPLAEATAIAFASPTFTTLLSVLLLKERVDAARWLVVLVGLGGVLVVMQPGTAAFQPAGLLALASALAWATSVMFTRKVAETDGVRTTMAYSALLGLALTTVVAGPGLRWPASQDWPALIGMGCAWCSAQWLVVAAYQRMSAAVLAPFAYAQLLFAALLGMWVFGHWPTPQAMLGMAIILACGGVAAWRARA